MKERERYYTEPLTNMGANIKGMAAAVKIVQDHTSVTRIAIITRQLNSTSILESFFNNPNAPKLFAKGAVQFPATTTNSIHSSMDKHSSIENEIIVTLGLNSDDLLLFEDKVESKFIVAVPWLKGETEKWSKITGAVQSQTLVTATPYNIPDCILKEVLDDMSTINKGSVPFHGSDHDRVKTYFKTLQENHIEMPVDVIESYLFKHKGWSKRAIDHAFTILYAIKEGRKIKGKVGDTKYFITKWQAAC